MDKKTKDRKTVTVKQGKNHYFTLYNKVFDELSRHYEELFIQNELLLLKLGIHINIFKKYKLSVFEKEVEKFLHRHIINSKTYQALNVVRYTLLGEESSIVIKEPINLMAKREEERKKRIGTEIIEKEKVKSNNANKLNLGLNIR